MIEAQLHEIEVTTAQFRATLRSVGDTSNMMAATEELLILLQCLVNECRQQHAKILELEDRHGLELARLAAVIEENKVCFTWSGDANEPQLVDQRGNVIADTFTFERDAEGNARDISVYIGESFISNTSTALNARQKAEYKLKNLRAIRSFDEVRNETK